MVGVICFEIEVEPSENSKFLNVFKSALEPPKPVPNLEENLTPEQRDRLERKRRAEVWRIWNKERQRGPVSLPFSSSMSAGSSTARHSGGAAAGGGAAPGGVARRVTTRSVQEILNSTGNQNNSYSPNKTP